MGTVLFLRVEGEDERDALEAVDRLFGEGFGEI
jgi:phosphotransferase system HPr-like phosphotransfer protein